MFCGESDGSERATHESSMIRQLEVHTVLGNEQGLLDGGVDAKLDRPTGLAQSLDGRTLIFCEYGSHTIREATMSGPAVRTISGQAGSGFQDGPCSSARFREPHGLCVVPTSDGSSVVIVADTGNNAVRCVNLHTNTVSTILCGLARRRTRRREQKKKKKKMTKEVGNGRRRRRRRRTRGKGGGKGNEKGQVKNGEEEETNEKGKEQEQEQEQEEEHDDDEHDDDEHDDDEHDDDEHDDDEHGDDDDDTKQPRALFTGCHFQHIVLKSPRGVCSAGVEHPGVFFVSDATKVIEVNLQTRTCRVLAGGGDLELHSGVGQSGFRDGSFRSALFDRPAGLAFDRTSGVLYVADTHNHVIRRLHNNQVDTIAGCGRAGYLDGIDMSVSVRLKFPQKIAVDEDRQRLYVSDLNDVVRGVTLPDGEGKQGRVFTMAGSGQPGKQDGASTTSTWQFPCGLVYSEEERVLYCADSDNHSIRTVVAHDGWVLPLDAKLYVRRAMDSFSLDENIVTSTSSSSSSSESSSSAAASLFASSSAASSYPSRPSPSRRTSSPRAAAAASPSLPPAMQSKFRRTLDMYTIKAQKELGDVNLAIFRTNYMLQFPSATVLLLAEALAVIVQDPMLSRPELDQVDPHDTATKSHRMSIFQKSRAPPLMPLLRSTPLGRITPRQVAKLVHCVQKLQSAQMSKAPDVHRLKKWIVTRCEAERFILEHNIMATTPFPAGSVVGSQNSDQDGDGESVGSRLEEDVNDLDAKRRRRRRRVSSDVDEKREQSSKSLGGWREESGDPEMPRSLYLTKDNGGDQRDDHDDGSALLRLGAGTGAQRYAQLSYHEVCRENELLRKEMETMRKTTRMILDVMEGALAAPGSSANHLALHSILGMPTSDSSAATMAGGTKDSGDGGSDDDTRDLKVQRQARQAAIIIEELERALGQ